MISVGYMDPGNWATDISGGSRYGYALLSVILLSNAMAMLLQALAVRLGIVANIDLAQACRLRYSPATCIVLWLLCELAIIACDLAEVIGTAIALQLLFHIPLLIGTLITITDTLLLLGLMRYGMRVLEAFVISLLVLITLCFSVQISMAKPEFFAVIKGFVPHLSLVTDSHSLFLALGIIGATVMPHNLYLHSSIVQSRKYPKTVEGIRRALRLATLDSSCALMFALCINAAILILAAAVFHRHGYTKVDDIAQAYHLLSPVVGTSVASILFGVALLASGMNSTITATLAGDIVMGGFLQLHIPQWLRRIVTRSLAIIPVISVIAIYGNDGGDRLLLLSQIILSMQLPFAVIPLLRCVTDKTLMKEHLPSRWLTASAWVVAGIIILLNLLLLFQTW